MTLFTAGEPDTLPTQAREVFDVTGAVDTVIAVLAAGIAAGLQRAGRRGSREPRRRHRRRQDRCGDGELIGAAGTYLHMQGSGGRGLVELPECSRSSRIPPARRARRDQRPFVFDILQLLLT